MSNNEGENMEKGNEIVDDLEIKAPEPEKKEVVPQAPQPILLDEKGRVIAKNNSELLRYCNAVIQSEIVPKWFDKPQKLFGALMFVRSLGLPDTSIRQTAVIHGVPSMFGDLPLALCQMSNDLNYFKEQWFDKDYNVICFENKNLHADVYGAVCFIARADNDVQSFSFTLEDAGKAGLWPAKKADGSASPNSPWSKYTKIMLRYKARSIGLKSLFADKLSGSAIMEYDYDQNDPNEIKDVTPEKELANELNKI